MNEDNRDRKEKSQKPKAKYEKPEIKTESLTAVAAVCNGTTLASRKASTGAPNFCLSTKIKS